VKLRSRAVETLGSVPSTKSMCVYLIINYFAFIMILAKFYVSEYHFRIVKVDVLEILIIKRELFLL
jgi:hypothetical protein